MTTRTKLDAGALVLLVIAVGNALAACAYGLLGLASLPDEQAALPAIWVAIFNMVSAAVCMVVAVYLQTRESTP